jgi:hypothetical protein
MTFELRLSENKVQEGTVVIMAIRLQTELRWSLRLLLERSRFHFSTRSQPILSKSFRRSAIQWAPGALSPGVKHSRGVMLTTHPLLLPKKWRSRSCTSPHPKAPVWSVGGPLYLLNFFMATGHCKPKLALNLVKCGRQSVLLQEVSSPGGSYRCLI